MATMATTFRKPFCALFLLALLLPLGACEDRNWEPIKLKIDITGEYADGSPIEISGDWGPFGDPRDRVEGVGKSHRGGDLGIDSFTPNQDTGDHQWTLSMTEMADPFFLWDQLPATVFVGQDEGQAMTLTNFKFRVDALRLDGRIWADGTFSGDLEGEGKGTAKMEGTIEMSYQCSNLFWSFGGFCDHFGHDGDSCGLAQAPDGCPVELAETFYAQGASSKFEGGQLTFGAEPLNRCVTGIPHTEKQLGPDREGHVDPGACISDVKTVSADGCDWDVQAVAYNRYGVNISARAKDGCNREVKSCQFPVKCGMAQNWEGP
jgi:hypothetical protein